MTRLIDLKSPRPRFARSINVERDAGGSAVDGYLPVGRAIDVISRLAMALDRDDVEVALSITGPYGSGKSSLAVVLDALLGSATEPARATAEEVLSHAAPDTLATLASARTRLGAHQEGFIRAVVTAQREPIAVTVVRALLHGVERYKPNGKARVAHSKARKRIRHLYDAYVTADKIRPEARDVRDAVADLGRVAPVLLLIDEFGKNLEAFADSHSDADLYLLQELAEWTRGREGLPLALVTLQHMAFDEYAAGASVTQRREWTKIQGRFEDIPFVDSPAQTRALIAAAFGDPDDELVPVVELWAKDQAATLVRLGLNDLAGDADLLARCWPLHPLALDALPQLCERYGQNERTLFSFLAGPGPGTVASFLADTEWQPGAPLPLVRLDQVYDYFLESAATMVGVSAAASRWVEIDTRIRDAHGIDEPARRVLKTVGVLNLVSAGGTLRASEGVVGHAVNGQPGTSTAAAVTERLSELESAGLVTYRDFADEYRVWQGSDFDLRSAIEAARRRLRGEPAASVVARVLPLSPLVAARHSHQTGTLRAFERRWIDPEVDAIEPLGSGDRPDGLGLYVLGSDAPTAVVARREDEKPVAFLTTTDPGGVITAAREVAAIDDVLAPTEDLERDWVARRELAERRVEARAALDHEFEAAYGTTSATQTHWVYARPATRRRWRTMRSMTPSMALSEIAKLWYGKAPVIRNDLLNRHELSSQAAKARRLLIEAMLANPDRDRLGISGFGPDRTMYLSVLRDLGLHRPTPTGWAFTEPSVNSSARPAWNRLIGLLRQTTTSRAKVTDIYDRLAAPPVGIRAGTAPILLITALLVHAEEIAVYEHGTFRPALTADVCERFLRNPGNFEVKHFASRTGHRAALLTSLADRLNLAASRGPRNGRVGSVLAVVSHLLTTVIALPEHVKKTTHVSSDALAVRGQLLTATEPDELLFRSIPQVLGQPPVPPSGNYDPAHLEEIADRLSAVNDELRGAYPKLLTDLRRALREEMRGPDRDLRGSLAARAREIDGKVIDPKVGRLLVALSADIPGENEWVEYVAMSLTGTPSTAWTDDDHRRFCTLLHDISGTFRRVEALNADLRSRSDGFDAVRVTVTRLDGAETAKLVWIDETRRRALATIIEDALTRLSQLTGSDGEARDMLLAFLGDSDLAASNGADHERAVTQVPYSLDDKQMRAAE